MPECLLLWGLLNEVPWIWFAPVYGLITFLSFEGEEIRTAARRALQTYTYLELRQVAARNV
jgi:hypothetical protein